MSLLTSLRLQRQRAVTDLIQLPKGIYRQESGLFMLIRNSQGHRECVFEGRVSKTNEGFTLFFSQPSLLVVVRLHFL